MVETRSTPHMKGLVVGCVIAHIKKYSFTCGNIYEGAKIGFGPHFLIMGSTDINYPAYERSNGGAYSETNRKLKLHNTRPVVHMPPPTWFNPTPPPSKNRANNS